MVLPDGVASMVVVLLAPLILPPVQVIFEPAGAVTDRKAEPPLHTAAFWGIISA